MGMDTGARQSASSPASEAPAARSAASPYGLSVTDAAGNIRKFVEMGSEIIRMAIARYNGHMSEVARRLGIGRSTLYRKLKEFGLEGDLPEEEENELRKSA